MITNLITSTTKNDWIVNDEKQRKFISHLKTLQILIGSTDNLTQDIAKNWSANIVNLI
jgi:hypothetical protein